MADQSNEMGMVERVARAIYAVDGGKGWHLHEKFYMDSARAAIEALKEPSEIMLEAMHNAMFADPFTGRELPMLGAGFEAALDAALSHDEVKG